MVRIHRISLLKLWLDEEHKEVVEALLGYYRTGWTSETLRVHCTKELLDLLSIVVMLLRCVADEHQVRSAFASIYATKCLSVDEAPFNIDNVVSLLRHTGPYFNMERVLQSKAVRKWFVAVQVEG